MIEKMEKKVLEQPVQVMWMVENFNTTINTACLVNEKTKEHVTQVLESIKANESTKSFGSPLGVMIDGFQMNINSFYQYNEVLLNGAKDVFSKIKSFAQ